MSLDTTNGRPDPILGAIDRHQAADAVLEAALAADNEKAKDIALFAEQRALWRLVEVRPTTQQGIWALCDHLADYGMSEDDQISGRQDYDRTRNWRFVPRLLENIRDALAAIDRK